MLSTPFNTPIITPVVQNKQCKPCKCVKVHVHKKKMDKQTKKSLIIASSVIGSAAVITAVTLGLVYGLKDSTKKDIKDKANTIMEDAKKSVNSAVEQAKESVKPVVEDVKESSNSFMDEAKNKINEKKIPTETIIKIDAFNPGKFPVPSRF